MDSSIIKPALDAEKIDIEEPKTIVPRNSRVSEFDARWALARILSHEEQTQQDALNLYVKLLQERPDTIDLHIEMGRLYITLKRFREGLALLYHALEMNPRNLKLLVATAQGEISAGHAEKARGLFFRALHFIRRL